jgi:hypothetical protein
MPRGRGSRTVSIWQRAPAAQHTFIHNRPCLSCQSFHSRIIIIIIYHHYIPIVSPLYPHYITVISKCLLFFGGMSIRFQTKRGQQSSRPSGEGPACCSRDEWPDMFHQRVKPLFDITSYRICVNLII